MRALRANGARIEPKPNDEFLVSLPGQTPYRIAFAEDALDLAPAPLFGGGRARVMLPGKPDFERLVQSWADKSAAMVVDRSRPPESEIKQYLSEWLSVKRGVTLHDHTVQLSHAGFTGTITCRASVSVAHDRLEKLIEVPVGQGGHGDGDIPEDAPLSVAECISARLAPDLRSAVEGALAAEPDLTKVADFYRKRCAEELAAAGGPAQRTRVLEQFTSVAAADAVAVKGVRHATLDVSARVSIGGKGPYPAEFQVVVGAGGSPIVTPMSQWTSCESTGLEAPLAATATCTLSRKRVLAHLLSMCAVSGHLALTELMARCDVSGKLLFPSETLVCQLTGKRARKDLLSRSEVSGRLALTSELKKCDFTGALVFPDELLTSEISGRLCRLDQTARSSTSGRFGHSSEFVESVDPKGQLAGDEAAQSDVSGAWAEAKRMVRSAIPPGRLGLASEAVTSAVSGLVALSDEVARSAISGKPALLEELAACDFTGVKCLPSELVTSDISGRKHRLDQKQRSTLSQRSGHRSEFVRTEAPAGFLALDEAEKSAVSGTWVQRGTLMASAVFPHRKALPGELVASAVSGKLVLPDEIARSAASGRPALPDEMVTCEATGDRVLPDEVIDSQISRRRVRADQVRTSAQSGRVGHECEFVEAVLPAGFIALDESAASDFSKLTAARERLVVSAVEPHRRGLPSECLQSAVSGLTALRDEVDFSAISDAPAIKGELRCCDFTQVLVLPSELLTSDVSGKNFRSDQRLVSVLSGRQGHSSEFVQSVSPTGWLAKDEAAQSAMSGEWGQRSALSASGRPPHRLGLSHEFVTCESTGTRLLRDEAAASAVSGKMVDSSLLVPSGVSGLRALPDEMVICAASGLRLLPDESGVCSVSGKRVDLRQLAASEESGALALRSLMSRCAESGKTVLTTEAVRCDDSGQLVLRTLTEECALTHRRGVRRLMKRCPGTGQYYIDDDRSRSRMRELTGSTELLGTCEWSAEQYLASDLGRCSISGLRLKRELLNPAREMVVLRHLLDGKSVRGSRPATTAHLEMLRHASPELKGAKDGLFCVNADHGLALGVLRVSSGLLGMTTRHDAVVINLVPTPSLHGMPVAGKRTPSGWERHP